MIHAYVPHNGTVDRLDVSGHVPIPDAAMWFDLLDPTADERLRVEAALGVQLPSREEMQEIEPSSRLYTEGNATYMTATIIALADTAFPAADPITFILVRRSLVTLRYHDPRPVTNFSHRLMRTAICTNGQDVLVGLLDAFVDRIADVLEKVALDLDAQTRVIFNQNSGAKSRRVTGDLQEVLRALGRDEDLATSARESLLSLNRMVSYLSTIVDATPVSEPLQKKDVKEQKTRIKTLQRDMTSLGEHAAFELAKVNFLLDATLGMINIEQNQIIKMFSIAAVVFLPPTLVASIYGMNFKILPELEWAWGYPWALVLMVLSAVLPYLYFKRRGWF